MRSLFLHLLVAVLALLRPAVAPADDLPGLHNLQQASATVLVGSEPDGEQAFQALKEKGVTVIVSVDGALPDTKLAAKFGIRYIHIPLGYDGVNHQSQLALVRVARENQSPLYVHCHHGRHRGPAAAAIICQAAGTMNADQASELLKRCGTSPDYKGLWRDVAAFRNPPAATKLPELVEIAKVESMPAAMAKLDRHFDLLKLAADAGWKTPPDHPDLVPTMEALLVQEGLAESLRLLTKDQPEALQSLMRESAGQAAELTNALRSGDTAQAEK
ncbi:MAG: hypothetical protein RL215_3377, partial [Planctomycetota bacterium]